jgi:hypothetical protein
MQVSLQSGGIPMRMPRMNRVLAIGTLVGSAVLFGGAAMSGPHDLGTLSANVPSARRSAIVPGPFTVRPSHTYLNASYTTGGVALRNRSEGMMNIGGFAGPTQAAWLYFTYLFMTTPPETLRIPLRRYFPAPTANVSVRAKLIATSLDPCWGGVGGAIYRAPVPVAFAVGNGEYRITVPASVVGLNTGEDPWDLNIVYPLDEGASLVLIGGGSKTVDLFDIGLAGNEFGTSLLYTLALSGQATGDTVLMDEFGADGQLGASRTSHFPGETTFINSVQVAGPGGAYDTDSDWNGNSGFPLPQLWDDTGHDIRPAVPAGTTSLAVSINVQNDCLVTVGNVISY